MVTRRVIHLAASSQLPLRVTHLYLRNGIHASEASRKPRAHAVFIAVFAAPFFVWSTVQNATSHFDSGVVRLGSDRKQNTQSCHFQSCPLTSLVHTTQILFPLVILAAVRQHYRPREYWQRWITIVTCWLAALAFIGVAVAIGFSVGRLGAVRRICVSSSRADTYIML